METFPIYETMWDEHQEEMVSTDKIVGYITTSHKGEVLGKGETIAESEEKAVMSLYPLEYAITIPKKAKQRRVFAKV